MPGDEEGHEERGDEAGGYGEEGGAVEGEDAVEDGGGGDVHGEFVACECVSVGGWRWGGLRV